MKKPSNNWTPQEIRKTIVLISGIFLLIYAIVMLNDGTSANGSIDIATNLFKGKIESGSGGLFLSFFLFS